MSATGAFPHSVCSPADGGVTGQTAVQTSTRKREQQVVGGARSAVAVVPAIAQVGMAGAQNVHHRHGIARAVGFQCKLGALRREVGFHVFLHLRNQVVVTVSLQRQR